MLQLIGKDISEGGALPLIDASEKAKGVQVSPYVVTNRTGVSLFINSEATIGVRLRTGEKAHLQSKSMDIVENGLNTICF